MGSVLTSPPRGKRQSASDSARGHSSRTVARETGGSPAGSAGGAGPGRRISGDGPETRRPGREPLPDAHSLEEESLEPRPGPRELHHPDGDDEEGGAEVRGAITVRGNVADRVDDGLVPGEFLYTYKRHYFSVQRDPPEEQVYEKTYYEPCAGCGRSANDPACQC